MKRRILFTLLLVTCCSLMSAGAVELGIDVLQKNNFDLLRGKRVGLVTNQTGVNSAGIKTVFSLSIMSTLLRSIHLSTDSTARKKPGWRCVPGVIP